MCEKQITVPCNSVLYCSERYLSTSIPTYVCACIYFILTYYSCRRKDSCKPLSASSYAYTMSSSTTITTTTTTPPSSPPMSPRAIVAPLTPTRSSSPTATPTLLSRIPSDLHEAKSDLDPTEWKPVIHHSQQHYPGRRTPSSTSLSSSSEAWTFLSQFHHPHYNHYNHNYERRSTASTAHRSSASLSSTLGGLAAPSLTHTPSTVASSVNSTASSSPLDYYNFGCYDAARPLPPRHNPSYTGATKGVELVVPHIAAPVLLDTTTTSTTTATGRAAAAAAFGSLASSPADSHDEGVWLKAHHRQSLSVAPGGVPLLVGKTH